MREAPRDHTRACMLGARVGFGGRFRSFSACLLSFFDLCGFFPFVFVRPFFRFFNVFFRRSFVFYVDFGLFSCRFCIFFCRFLYFFLCNLVFFSVYKV